jgi:hypothetical protein
MCCICYAAGACNVIDENEALETAKRASEKRQQNKSRVTRLSKCLIKID